jgi:toluene monooxygenase system ferredoxin subunit
MAFKPVYKLDDMWEGDMVAVEVNGHEILLLRGEGDDVNAFQGICPHQEIPLSEGELWRGVLTCRAHLWTFDLRTCQGINPEDSKLARYPVRVEGGDVCVDTEGVTPFRAIG